MVIVHYFCRMLMDPVGKKAFAIHFTKVRVKHNNKLNLCTFDYMYMGLYVLVILEINKKLQTAFTRAISISCTFPSLATII